MLLAYNVIKKNKKKNECSICCDVITNNNNCVLSCGHKFHLNCILILKRQNTNYSNKCPMCRSDIENNASQIPSNSNDTANTLIEMISHFSNRDLNFLSYIIQEEVFG